MTQGSTFAFRSGVVPGFRGKATSTVLKDGVHVHVRYIYQLRHETPVEKLIIPLDGDIRISE